MTLHPSCRKLIRSDRTEKKNTMNQITQDHISEQTPYGTNLIQDSGGAYLGVTVRVWGPSASEVYLNGRFNGVNSFTQDQDKNLLLKKRGEDWTGFLDGAKPGDT
jgi:hypothetical protein